MGIRLQPLFTPTSPTPLSSVYDFWLGEHELKKKNLFSPIPINRPVPIQVKTTTDMTPLG